MMAISSGKVIPTSYFIEVIQKNGNLWENKQPRVVNCTIRYLEMHYFGYII